MLKGTDFFQNQHMKVQKPSKQNQDNSNFIIRTSMGKTREYYDSGKQKSQNSRAVALEVPKSPRKNPVRTKNQKTRIDRTQLLNQ